MKRVPPKKNQFVKKPVNKGAMKSFKEAKKNRDLEFINIDDEDEAYEEYEDEYVDEYEDYAKIEQENENEYYEEYEEYEEDAISFSENEYDDEYENEYYDDSAYEEEGIVAIWHNIQDWFYDRSVVDFLMMGGGLLAAAVLVVFGIIFFKGELVTQGATAEFASIGNNVAEIGIIGKDGILSATKVKIMEEAEYSDELSEEELADIESAREEAEAQEVVTTKTAVVMNLSSIQRDLKIKFVNNTTSKLMTGVEFEVSITDPSGKKSTKTNSDRDGIIHLKDIKPGTYKVSLVGPKSDDYEFLSDPVSIKVKDTIEYKKVDVSNEIKKESEVNVAKEDTAKRDTQIESQLTDTVEWVESTKTLVDGTGEEVVTYEQVKSTEISDPGKTSSLKLRLLGKRYEPENSPDPGSSENPDISPEPSTEPSTEPSGDPSTTPSEDPSTAPSEAPSPVPSEEPTPTTLPTESPSPSSDPTESPSPSLSPSLSPSPSMSPSPSLTPTPTLIPSPTPTPTATPSKEELLKKDETSILKTGKGEELYVKEGDNYRKAHYADYYKENMVFYRAVKSTKGGQYRYTGWQTIDGRTFFFDKNGNFVTGEQVIQGAKYTFGSDGALASGSGAVGIDVSKWNGSIDWNAVRNSGVSYVIIRCGFRGSTAGGLIEDANFRSNIKGAQNAGLKVGLYFFSQAINEAEAVEEASMCLNMAKGYNVSYPIFLDMEPSGGRADSLSVDARTKVAKAFCQTIANSGYKSGVYANKTWFNSYLNTPSITGYKIWLAQYAAAPSYTKTRFDLWQYTSKGKVSGISGNVDMNISYLGY